MKYLLSALFFWLSSLIIPLFANEGDFENRLREAEMAGNRQEVASICKEWYASGQYSSGLLNWNYNALMSVEPNALLFTQQESDTYPAMLLQYALDVRPDVHVISFQLLENHNYRTYLIESEGLGWIPKECSMSDFIGQILNPKAPQSSMSMPVYFGSMTNKNLLQADKEKLYLTGLALKFSLTAFDNVATLRYNFENRFRTDYLDLSFEPETDPETVAHVNLNYIPALLLLHRHYNTAGESEKAARLQSLAIRIAKAGGRESEVRTFFTPEKPSGEIISAISAKNLEKIMKKVGGRLYAAETETTNAQYEAFLSDLLKNKDFDQLNKCKTTQTDWTALMPKELQHLPTNQMFDHGNPDQPEFPVQNISHEAAQRYCTWITQVYNASSEKKKFKKVLFRLPTEEEWMEAARGGLKEAEDFELLRSVLLSTRQMDNGLLPPAHLKARLLETMAMQRKPGLFKRICTAQIAMWQVLVLAALGIGLFCTLKKDKIQEKIITQVQVRTDTVWQEKTVWREKMVVRERVVFKGKTAPIPIAFLPEKVMGESIAQGLSEPEFSAPRVGTSLGDAPELMRFFTDGEK